MAEFFSNLAVGVGVTDIIDIAVIAFAIYKLLGWIHQTRAEQLVKGIIVIIVIMLIAGALQLYALNWLIRTLLSIGVVAIVVVFQPELRRLLEKLGRSRFFARHVRQLNKDTAMTVINRITIALEKASLHKEGTLIIIERETSLEELCEKGVSVDAEISVELIGTIFYEGSPLHDGAVIIRGDRIVSAGCVLPLTSNSSLPTELGTRHRAAIGVTEISDAIAIVVSEETGIMSYARDGKLTRFLDTKFIEKILMQMYLRKDNNQNSKAQLFKKKAKGGSDVSE